MEWGFPRGMTRKERVLRVLKYYQGEWVDGMMLMNAEVGGTRAGARIYDLRQEGHDIRERRDPEHKSAVSQYKWLPPMIQMEMFQ